MLRSPSTHRSSLVRRLVAAWLALAYLSSSAAGAVGLAACVHSAHGDGGHAAHAGPAEQHASGAHGGHRQASPCAAARDATADGNDEPGHGPAAPCDCLGDCSLGTAPCGAPPGKTIEAPGTFIEQPVAARTRASDATSAEYLLPFPNGPPLSS